MSKTKSTPIELLEAAGLALYGARWHRPLAAALEIDKETLRRWKNGTTPVTEAHLLHIYTLLRARQNEIGATADALMSRVTGQRQK